MIVISIIDNLRSGLDHIRFNRRQIFISAIGLLIALSIISSASIFVDSQRSVLIEEILDMGYNQNHWRLTYSRDGFGDTENLLPEIINNTLKEYDFSDKIEKITEFSRIGLSMVLTENSSLERGYDDWFRLNSVYEMNQINLSYFEPYAEKTLKNIDYSNEEPYNIVFDLYYEDERYYEEIETIAIENVTINKTYELIQRHPIVKINNNLKISNIINMSNIEFFELTRKTPELQDLWGFRGNSLIVKNYSHVFQEKICGEFTDIFLGEDPETGPEVITYYNFSAIYECELNVHSEFRLNIRFDINKFDLFDVSSTIKRFEAHDIALYNELLDLGYINHQGGFSDIYIDNNLRWTLEGIQSISTILFTAIMLFTFPIIIIAIFLAYYSFGLIQRNTLQGLNIYLTRGITRQQYFSFLIFEMVFALILAIFGAILLSIPITSLSLKTSDFFEFERLLSPVILLFHLINLLIQFGIILALFTNIIRVIKLSRLDINQVEQIIVEEREAPFWRRKFLDIILLGFGLLFYLLTVYAADFEIFLPPEFYLIFSLPSPLLIIVGSVMLTSRLFSLITGIIGTFLWEKQGSLIAFSLKNSAKHRHAVTRALILVSLTLAFSLSFLIFPFSFISYGETTIHYNIGSDISITFYNEEINYTHYDYILANFSNQIEGYSPIIKGELENQNIMVINTSTFLEAAWMRDDFVPNMEKSIKSLSEENRTVLMYHENLGVTGRDVGQKFVWRAPWYDDYIEEFRNQTNHELKVTGEFNYWPRLINWRPWEPQRELFGVISFETFNNMSEQLGNESEYAFHFYESVLYVQPKESMNQTLFVETLEELDGIASIQSYKRDIDFFKGNSLYLVVIGQINSNILYCILIIFIILAMFGFKQLIERSKEIATEIAMGMTLRQTFSVFLTETMWLILFSISIGVVFGIVFSSLFLVGLTQGPTFPPFQMVFPWHLISIIIGILLSLGLALSFIPAYLSSRLEVSKLLKVE
ncbi:MAG: hypothetical protein HeimC3_08710 [Candidatus Heimdallarchaeota archaeon LC_3]|nr:MAG: hypothetical protein HeimC3_08710 [Candidatus Heimdallarchaeota archaeon LC_3]